MGGSILVRLVFEWAVFFELLEEIDSRQRFLRFQTPTINLILFGSLFLHWLVFLEASRARRIVLFLVGAGGAFCIFFSAFGALDNPMKVIRFFDVNLPTGHSLQYLRSNSGWIFAFTIWGSCWISSFCWLGLSDDLRFCVNKRPREQRYVFARPQWVVFGQIAVLVGLGFYSLLLFSEHLLRGIGWTLAVFWGVFLSSLLFAICRCLNWLTNNLGINFVAVSWCAINLLVVIFVGLFVGLYLGFWTVELVSCFGWGSTSVIGFLVLAWLLGVKFQNRIVLKTQKKVLKKKVDVDPLADEDEFGLLQCNDVEIQSTENSQRVAVESANRRRDSLGFPLGYFPILIGLGFFLCLLGTLL